MPLNKDTVSGYRQLVARTNSMAQDTADIQYAVKEVCRGMVSPTRGHWRQVKRLGRYLKGRPRAVAKFSWQQQPSQVDGFSDSDWAGCRRTAWSTSGGTIMMGSHDLKSWSATQLKSLYLQQRQSSLRQFELAANASGWSSWLQIGELMLKPTHILTLCSGHWSGMQQTS